MGVCQSALDEIAKENPEFQELKDDGHRQRENKQTGEMEDFEAGDNQPESDVFLFEEEVIKEGEEFMAVKPWIGAVKEPVPCPENNSDAPDVCYNLEYAYGYRCQDSRNNVYYN